MCVDHTRTCMYMHTILIDGKRLEKPCYGGPQKKANLSTRLNASGFKTSS